MSSVKNIKRNSLQAWVVAARPKTLSAAAMPVAVGCVLALTDGCFSWIPAALCLLFALLMQIAANFINDLADFRKGGDTADRLGPPRACAEGWISERAMLVGIIITVCLACAFGLCLLFYGGWQLILVGAACVIFAALYSALAYHSLGDILVIVFFGFAAVGVTYYVLCDAFTWRAAVASLGCGLAIDTLLTVNNIRDREQDAAAGKRTLAVRLGDRGAKRFYYALGVLATFCAVALWCDGHLRLWAGLLPLVYFALHVVIWNEIKRIGGGRGLNRTLGLTSLNIIIYGIILIVIILQ